MPETDVTSAETEAVKTPEAPVAAEKPDVKSDDTAGLQEALRKERELRKAAEAQVKKATRTADERIADLEAETRQLRVERLRESAINEAIEAATADGKFTVSRADVMELLEDVNLTEANVRDAVTKRVEKLKKPVAVVTPDNATRADNGKREEVSIQNYRNFL